MLRGHADSMALKLACHDPAVHRRLAPQGPEARSLFDSVEQARVEAIGAKRMEGVASNLTAMLQDRYHRGAKYEDITERADAPLEDAVALMVRERLTGESPPPAAKKLVDLWRAEIEAKAGASSIGSTARSTTSALSPASCATFSPISTWPKPPISRARKARRARTINRRRTSSRRARKARKDLRASRPRWSRAKLPRRSSRTA